MKKISATLLFFLSATLISISMVAPAMAEIQRFTWLPPYVEKGWSNYYGAYVVVYRHGSTVELIVPVNNNVYSNGLNVSKVIVGFDWGQNKTLDLSGNIRQVEFGRTEIFTVSFTASAVEAVSSEWAHTYIIHVEHVNATTEPNMIVGTWSVDWNDFPSLDYKFVVFSADQADALDLSDEYDSYTSAYPLSYFNSVNGSQLRGQAVIEAYLGDIYYSRGEYASARMQYQSALDLYSQALTAEMNWATKIAEAELDVILTQAAVNMTYADAALTTAEAALMKANAVVNQSYAWILFAFGFVIFGLAGLVYAARKPRKPE